MLLHAVQWEASSPTYDESVFRLNSALKVVWWNAKRAEQLILQLAPSVPHLAQAFYALAERPKEQQQLVVLAILYEHGGLYVRPDGVAKTEFPQGTSFRVSTNDGQWAYALHERDPILLATLKEYAKSLGKAESAWAMARKRGGGPEGKQREEKAFSFGEGSEATSTILDSISEKIKDVTTKTSIWTQIAMGFGVLLLVSAIIYGLWRFFEPKKIASAAFDKAQRWLQERLLRGWDEKIASSATEILHKIVTKQ